MPTATITTKGQLTLPKPIRDYLKVDRGDRVEFLVDTNGVVTDLTLKQIIRLGIYQYKVERAIQLYRDGVGSLGYVAEQMGLNKQDLIREVRHHNIDPEYSEQTIKEELSKWH